VTWRFFPERRPGQPPKFFIHEFEQLLAGAFFALVNLREQSGYGWRPVAGHGPFSSTIWKKQSMCAFPAAPILRNFPAVYALEPRDKIRTSPNAAEPDIRRN
jgi:hypothetical protein